MHIVLLWKRKQTALLEGGFVHITKLRLCHNLSGILKIEILVQFEILFGEC